MANFISRPSFVLCDDTRLHKGVGYVFCTAGLLAACFRLEVWILWGGLLAAGLTALLRAKRAQVLVEIGPGGIWTSAEFVTDWAGFVRARVTSETVYRHRQRAAVYQILEIDHRHEDGSVFRRRINISDAPHFEEEQLMDAIAHFHGFAVVRVVPGRGREIWLDCDGDPGCDT